MLISAGHEAAQHARPIQPVFWSAPPVPAAPISFNQRPPLIACQQDNPDQGPGEAAGITASAGLFTGGVPQQARPLLVMQQLPLDLPQQVFASPLNPGPAATTTVYDSPIQVTSARHAESLQRERPANIWLFPGSPPVVAPPIPVLQGTQLVAAPVGQREASDASAYSLFNAGVPNPYVPPVTPVTGIVPNVVGMYIPLANFELLARSCRIGPATAVNSGYPVGIVLSQSVPAGTTFSLASPPLVTCTVAAILGAPQVVNTEDL